MIIAEESVRGRFLTRENRFLARTLTDAGPVHAHVPNSARMKELLRPGAEVILRPARGSTRKTRYTLVLVRFGKIWVSIDSLVPNKLLKEALKNRSLPDFEGYTDFRSEVMVGGKCRMDFLLTDAAGGRCYLEVKSVTLAREGFGLFPDAPTHRGARHLRELVAMVSAGGAEGAVLFVVQRGDVNAFRPNDPEDPAFGVVLREAKRAGVKVAAIKCSVSDSSIELAERIPVLL